MTSDDPYQGRAARHELRAQNYLQKAEMLLTEYSDPDSASALMYEAAKQCINAVANQCGANPATTGGKVNALRALVGEQPGPTDLMGDWEHASRLHIHADRGILTDAEYAAAWEGPSAFIDDMLTIYASRST